ncbi:hypothetical protein [Desertivibrio insolitus]|uniref:hypothetical protein n=1 Tax=Herbiconiux sp. SYSU D00978 TaxID=2812562 RepID=UPI001A97A2D1|nr:hypothetical protein [Herbiconiux sp. SYSU D00978]
MRQQQGDPTNPFGKRGFWDRWNRFFYIFSGPAQVGVGVGKKEAPYVPPADPTCPLCGKLLADHRIERGTGNQATRLHCPE